MNRILAWTIAIAVFAGLCWLFPLFHVVPLEQAAKKKAATVFNPTQFAEKFWNEQLLKSLGKAVPAEVLLPAIQANATEARKKFSRSLGVSDSYTYFIAGEGRVTAVSEDEVSLAITAGAMNPEVALPTGLLFGNAVRDGTGLLDVNDYSNSQDFNAISEGLNRIIETKVQPILREQAKIGSTVRFAGCAEVNDETTDLKPLRVVPIQIEVQSPGK